MNTIIFILAVLGALGGWIDERAALGSLFLLGTAIYFKMPTNEGVANELAKLLNPPQEPKQK